MEYAPFWIIAGLTSERIIMGRLEYIRWSDEDPVEVVSPSIFNSKAIPSTNGTKASKHKRQN